MYKMNFCRKTFHRFYYANLDSKEKFFYRLPVDNCHGNMWTSLGIFNDFNYRHLLKS
jgi:hypothetical protein